MASIKQRNGKYQVRWYDEEGKQRSRTFTRRRDAERAAARFEADAQQIRAGLVSRPRARRSFREITERWIRDRTDKRSLKTDRSFIRAHLEPAFGHLELKAIGPAEIASYKRERTHLSRNTINHHLTLLKSLMIYAKELGWIEDVPKVDRYRLGTPEFRYLKTVGEVRMFLAEAREMDEAGRRYSSGVPSGYFPLYAAGVYTGLRIGELAGLRWDDIELEHRLITVRRSYDGPTKNSGIRHVPLLDGLDRILRDWRLRSGAATLVFPNRAGRMMTKDSRPFKAVLRTVLERAALGDGYITAHGMRHTFASHWMMRGGCIFKLQRILGHRDISTTQRYAHLAPDAFQDDLDRLSHLAPGASNEPSTLFSVDEGSEVVALPGLV